MGTEKSPDPRDRLGVYKDLDEVIPDHRLNSYAATYDGRDTWRAFIEAQENAFDSECYYATIRKAGRTWKAHMDARGRHHALAWPSDVELWCRDLAESRELSTVYSEYWVRVEQFYDWLLWHTDHPHRYSPVLVAAAAYETAGGVWAEKVGGAFDPREVGDV